MRFKIVIKGGGIIEANGEPSNDPYPDFFVDDDGWTYPMTAIKKYQKAEDE